MEDHTPICLDPSLLSMVAFDIETDIIFGFATVQLWVQIPVIKSKVSKRRLSIKD